MDLIYLQTNTPVNLIMTYTHYNYITFNYIHLTDNKKALSFLTAL